MRASPEKSITNRPTDGLKIRTLPSTDVENLTIPTLTSTDVENRRVTFPGLTSTEVENCQRGQGPPAQLQ